MMAFLTATVFLAIAVLSIHFYQNSDHEVVKVLTAAITIVCLIAGFAASHWVLNVIGLMLLMNYKFPFALKPISLDK